MFTPTLEHLEKRMGLVDESLGKSAQELMTLVKQTKMKKIMSSLYQSEDQSFFVVLSASTAYSLTGRLRNPSKTRYYYELTYVSREGNSQFWTKTIVGESNHDKERAMFDLVARILNVPGDDISFSYTGSSIYAYIQKFFAGNVAPVPIQTPAPSAPPAAPVKTFLRINKSGVSKLWEAQKLLETMYTSATKGSDFDQKSMNALIDLLDDAQKEVKEFKSPEDLTPEYK